MQAGQPSPRTLSSMVTLLLVLVLGVGVLGAACVLLWKATARLGNQSPPPGFLPAQGRVVEFHAGTISISDGPDRTVHYPVLSFFDQQGRPVTATSPVGTSFTAPLGSIAPLWFDPQDPQEIFQPVPGARVIMWGVRVFLVVFLLLGGCMLAVFGLLSSFGDAPRPPEREILTPVTESPAPLR